jgi:hypothetical protein
MVCLSDIFSDVSKLSVATQYIHHFQLKSKTEVKAVHNQSLLLVFAVGLEADLFYLPQT